MGYTIEQLEQMSFEELSKVTAQDIIEDPPRRSAGIPYIVRYRCRFCGQEIEGSERRVKDLNSAKPVKCPYCKAVLWTPENKNCLRKTAFRLGHFGLERKKAYLKYLRDWAKWKEKL